MLKTFFFKEEKVGPSFFLKKKDAEKKLTFGTILSSVKQESIQDSQCKPCSLADHVRERDRGWEGGGEGY